MFYAKDGNGVLITAHNANKNCDYKCPHCQNKVILKKGTMKTAHFAHVHRSSNFCNKGETYEHYMFKYELAQQLNKLEYYVVIEPYIYQCYQYPDLIINNKIAIEIQFSNITIDNIKKRSNALASIGFDVIWIIGKLKYNKRTKILILNKSERTYINLKRRQLFSWHSDTFLLYRYKIVQFIGGNRYIAIREQLSYKQFTYYFNKNDSPMLPCHFKLTKSSIEQYIKYCRRQRTVREPSLSVIYNLQLTESWVCENLGMVYPEQIFVQSHPIYWQLQLLNMLDKNNINEGLFLNTIKYNHFYNYDVNSQVIVQAIIYKFQKSYRNIRYKNVQN
ncbi:competence protein [Staphylococcus xylosus]|uniref:competence protein CoiA n=1 Tax=Staphylococcus xylosus TaxID=1288 RepID=UPI000E684387|nr:competence protein CoiA family protein [Staphylococcus xylosus]RIM78143.1 competence protein [Staphylococcus xylosus]